MCFPCFPASIAGAVDSALTTSSLNDPIVQAALRASCMEWAPPFKDQVEFSILLTSVAPNDLWLRSRGEKSKSRKVPLLPCAQSTTPKPNTAATVYSAVVDFGSFAIEMVATQMPGAFR